jgi:hypothetical protein
VGLALFVICRRTRLWLVKRMISQLQGMEMEMGGTSLDLSICNVQTAATLPVWLDSLGVVSPVIMHTHSVAIMYRRKLD